MLIVTDAFLQASGLPFEEPVLQQYVQAGSYTSGLCHACAGTCPNYAGLRIGRFYRYSQLVKWGSIEDFEEILEAWGSFSYILLSLPDLSSFQTDINFSSLIKL